MHDILSKVVQIKSVIPDSPSLTNFLSSASISN
jgi:hypothetical protein